MSETTEREETYPAMAYNRDGSPQVWVHADALEALGIDVLDELEAEIIDGELIIRRPESDRSPT